MSNVTDYNLAPPGIAEVPPPAPGGLAEVTPQEPQQLAQASPPPDLAGGVPKPLPSPPVAPDPANSTFEPSARINNPIQQQAIAWRAAGYSDDQINKTLGGVVDNLMKQGYTREQVAKTMGIQPTDIVDTALAASARQQVDKSPPEPDLPPLEQFMHTLTLYTGLGELVHWNVPKEADKTPQGWQAQTAQAVAQVVGSGALMLGATALTRNPLAGVAIGSGVDSFIRYTYGDAIASGQTEGPPDFANHLVDHVWEATKDAAVNTATAYVGGKVGGALVDAGYGQLARLAGQGTAELATLTGASAVIQGHLPTWESFRDNAIFIVGLHTLGLAGGKAKDAAAAGVKAVATKLDEMGHSRALDVLIKNWQVAGEKPEDVTARILRDTTLEGLKDKANGMKVAVDPKVDTAWVADGVETMAPSIRTAWFNSAVTDGVDVASQLLAKAKAAPAGSDVLKVFNDLRRAAITKDFQQNPGKYGGSVDDHLTRFDTKMPLSKEELDAAKVTALDAQSKPVRPFTHLQDSVPTAGGLMRKGIDTLRLIFHPENYDATAKDAVALIRDHIGTAIQATKKAAASVTNTSWRALNAVDDMRPVIRHIEGAPSKLLPVGYGKVKEAADRLRMIVEQRNRAIDTSPALKGLTFDLSHMDVWTDPKAAKEFYGDRKGSKGFSIGDGLAHGLELKVDPVTAILKNVAEMDRQIAMAGVHEVGAKAGDIVYKKPPDDGQEWVRLKTSPGSHVDAFAPKGFATIYNNFVSKGMGDIAAEFGDAYQHVQRMSNVVSALKLALSAYHFTTVTLRSISSSFALGFDELATGHPIMAAATIIKTPFAPVRSVFKGYNTQQVYLGLREGSEMDQRAVALAASADARLAGRQGIDIDYSKKGSFVTSLARGSLGAELVADLKTAVRGDLSGPAGAIAENVGRFMEMLGQPLFDKYIPWLKAAATRENIGSWLERNPGASHAEALQATRDIADAMDNRFGEMVHDNVFMNKFLKQTGSLAMLSWSWTFGEEIRAIGGGVTDATKFLGNIAKLKVPEWTPRMSYLIAEAMTTAMFGAIYQFVKTGEWPSSLQDFFAPRTGGTVNGKPERANIPGITSNMVLFMENPPGELINKLSPALKGFFELMFNRDWRGKPIVPWNVTGAQPIDFMKEYANYLGTLVQPIAVASKPPPGSNYGPVETNLGFRQATPFLRDPEEFGALTEHFADLEWRSKIKADAVAKAKSTPQAPRNFGGP